MRLNQLVLRNFRSYTDCEIEFTDRVNLIVGENAQGKTTLLEAIYFLSTAKSHRTYPDNELIRHNESWFYLKGEVTATDSSQPNPEPHDLQPLNLMTVEVSNELSARSGSSSMALFKKNFLNGSVSSTLFFFPLNHSL